MAQPLEEHELSHHPKVGKGLSNGLEYDYDPDKVLSLKLHWGLNHFHEEMLFYCFAVPAWILEIAAAALGANRRTSSPAFIGCVTAFLVCHSAAWLQTVFGMAQRASWRREHETVPERTQFLYLAIRLQRLMLPTAITALVTFIVAYVKRYSEHNLAYWLLFLLFFIFNIVCSVMNAYNNITWESDRLYYDDRAPNVPSTRRAVLGL